MYQLIITAQQVTSNFLSEKNGIEALEAAREYIPTVQDYIIYYIIFCLFFLCIIMYHFPSFLSEFNKMGNWQPREYPQYMPIRIAHIFGK